MAKFLIITGILMVIAGVILHFSSLPAPGKLPGDIVINRGNIKVYFPVATSILISLVITIIFFFLNKAKQ